MFRGNFRFVASPNFCFSNGVCCRLMRWASCGIHVTPLAWLRGTGCAGALLASGGFVSGQGAVPEPALPPGLTAPPVSAPPAPPRAVAPAPVAPAARTVPLALARYNGSYFVIPERSDSTILAINPVVNRLPWFVRGVARNRL